MRVGCSSVALSLIVMVACSGCGGATTHGAAATATSVGVPQSVIATAQRVEPKMESATTRAVTGEMAALDKCAAATRFDMRRLEPLRLATIYSAIAPMYAEISATAQRAPTIDPQLRRAITRRSRQFARFRRARLAVCPILRGWVADGRDTDAPLYRALGLPRSAFPGSHNGLGDPTIRGAVESLRARGYGDLDIQRLRLTLDPVLNSLQ